MKLLFRGLTLGLGGLFLLTVVYFLGPQVAPPSLDTALPTVPNNLHELEQEITARENSLSNIKPDNEARIIWADSIPTKTPYSIVYLHGWSASQGEGDPLHKETAKRYGCNLYLPRLKGHGLQEQEGMLTLTADQLLDSAKEAIAVAKELGDQVIVMATSTGGTLALHLVGGDPDIAALMLYSPNIEIFDPSAKLLGQPWGLQLARLVKGSDYHEFDTDIPLKNQYWTTKYRLEALTQLQVLMEATMTEPAFEKVNQPLFLGYYYKDEVHQDSVVSVAAQLRMFDALGTPESQKRKVAFPAVGDHVMTSYITSKDLESVTSETFQFLEEVVGLQPK